MLALKGVLVAPPANVEGFDAAASKARLERIIGDAGPHPVDSDANDAVRERLVAELRAIGLDPDVTDRMQCRSEDSRPTISCARIRNVIATIGSGDRPHLLLNSHYDSTDVGEGAADDGIGVAVMLSVAEALTDMPAPARPVTFLFNEGEERGLIGAAAFDEDNSIAERVDTLINIEARGTEGPALMFRQSSVRGDMIGLYGEVTPRPAANSLSSDFANLIPNRTDGEHFRRAGRDWDVLEYAIAFNEARYHSAGDTVAALDTRTLGQMGSQVLAATRALADGPAAAGPRRVYSDVGGLVFLSLPLTMAAAIFGIALVGLLVFAVKRGAFGALGFMLLAFATAFGAAVAAGWGLSQAVAGQFWRGTPLPTYLAIHAAMLAGLLLAHALRRGAADRRRDRVAAWLLVALIGMAASLFLPGALILFLVGPTLTFLGLLAGGRVERLASWAAIIVQAVLIAQFVALMEEILIAGPLWAGAPLVALVALPLLVEVLPHERRAALPLPPAIIAAGLAILALAQPMTSARSPGPLSFVYERDDSADLSAVRALSDGRALPDPVSNAAEWRKFEFTTGGGSSDAVPVEPFDAPAARMTRLSSRKGEDGRIVRYRLQLDDRITGTVLRIEEGSGVRAAGIGEEVLPFSDAGDGPALLRCYGRACDGAVIEVRFDDDTPVDAELEAFAPGVLPPAARTLADARPDDYLPKGAPDGSLRRTHLML
ncbi:M28 family peptidase [Sphingomicrobium sp. XHP0239]|uniref:M28 family peptidase n=1 Tax=Sphingomicrobium maritimum TaxID=3133972 RepID=UPI0031CC9E60